MIFNTNLKTPWQDRGETGEEARSFALTPLTPPCHQVPALWTRSLTFSFYSGPCKFRSPPCRMFSEPFPFFSFFLIIDPPKSVCGSRKRQAKGFSESGCVMEAEGTGPRAGSLCTFYHPEVETPPGGRPCCLNLFASLPYLFLPSGSVAAPQHPGCQKPRGVKSGEDFVLVSNEASALG